MNAISRILPRSPAIAWPLPVINDTAGALEDAGLMTERLRALITSNNADLLSDVAHGLDSADELRRRATEIWMIGIVAEEKLLEIERILAATAAAAAAPASERRSSVAKHVDLKRSREFREAAESLAALNASEDPDDRSDGAAAAFEVLFRSRVTSPAEFREKMDIIAREAAFTTHGVIQELFRDLDALGWTRASVGEA